MQTLKIEKTDTQCVITWRHFSCWGCLESVIPGGSRIYSNSSLLPSAVFSGQIQVTEPADCT